MSQSFFGVAQPKTTLHMAAQRNDGMGACVFSLCIALRCP